MTMFMLPQNPAIVTDPRERCLVLARARMDSLIKATLMAWTLEPHAQTLLTADYSVESATNPQHPYRLRYDARRDDAACDCHAGLARFPCWHRGAVLIKARQLARERAQRKSG